VSLQCDYTSIFITEIICHLESVDVLIIIHICLVCKQVYKLTEGVGYATCNVAEYRAVILGLKVALSHGISQIQVKGDSKLVCKQVSLSCLFLFLTHTRARVCMRAHIL
jgi:ribonuclease HI